MRFFSIVRPLAALSVISTLVTFGCSSSSDNKQAAGVGGTAGSISTGGASNAGAANIGGTTSHVGTSSTGGTSSTAGAPSTGGASSTAGAPSTGGAPSGTGGATTVAGTTGGSTLGVGGSNTGGASSTSSTTLDDLIGAICNWEFKCCDAGEAKWELGPIVTTAALCKERFVYLLRNDNAASSPYPASGSPAISGLLIALGYQVDMTKVTENPAGIAQCIAQWNALGCNVAADPKAVPTHCAATSVGVTDPCNLTNLVTPKVPAGGICNFALTEGAYNDVECVVGSTCLDTTNVDNPNKNYPTCVTRGIASASCTLDKDCDFNFYCSSNGHCTEKGAAGVTCSYKTPATPVPGQLDAPCKPGLSCNPTTLKCVDNCTAGYVCNSTAADGGNDFICPAGSSCVPVTVGNDSTSFKVCSTIGATAGAKCNSLEDCAAGLYCAGTSCAPRQGLGLACSTTTAGNCVTGMYCKAGATPVCASYVGNGLACVQATTGIASTECDPTTAIGCVYKWDTTLATPAASYICSNAPLANDQRCGNDFDCVSNRCEYASLAASYKTCIVGAAAGASCDAVLTAGTYTRCAAGLACLAGQCVAQVGPGGNCESTSSTGTADPNLCKSNVCNATQWTTIAAGNIMCTDTAVPVLNGGTGVTCDGKP